MKLNKTTGAALAIGVAAAAAALVVGVSPAHADAKIIGADSKNAVSGQYIVAYEDGVKMSDGKSMASDVGAKVRKTFDSINAVSVSASEEEAKELAGDSDVKYVQANLKHTVSGTQDNPPSWGQDRVDQEAAEGDSKYNYPDSAGEGVTSYTIDTGVAYDHPDFEGRTAEGFDAVDGDTDPADGHGHGTHVTGTIAGTEFGLAKKATIVGVRVLDDQGSGTTEQVAGGIDWVTENHAENSVANMSLGGPEDQVLDDATTKSIESGVTYAVAAGNESSDACGVSPARVPEAITAGATDNTDAQADFSNFGKCVDVYAPGVDIVSAAPGGGEATMSGTSMASPHVAGAAALYVGANPGAAPADVAKALTENALKDVVQNPGEGSPNLLLNTQFLQG
ncbi:S8 family peptidase [Stackebrandtia nassauensis]|uniref:Peptidase S8 and S53 subtilisin kexin sedolisin n=1 Tax=Stackebrandtia nassauensis (strain DSM 44728 / CIP 108903 / NRRL B-16338 / NBRC 102104 / LLR-40K-21) TaxID=446470 RepID=D3QA35_STANL|nr:S8 family peptidase [Stackebrandtia nassauensis]ADD40747.1 peptidase S8 and S53 subtilisin kexin sedolisin [Stackebrandtia nassauensis DSM 44728]